MTTTQFTPPHNPMPHHKMHHNSTAEMLENELGVSGKLHRKKILQLITELTGRQELPSSTLGGDSTARDGRQAQTAERGEEGAEEIPNGDACGGSGSGASSVGGSGGRGRSNGVAQELESSLARSASAADVLRGDKVEGEAGVAQAKVPEERARASGNGPASSAQPSLSSSATPGAPAASPPGRGGAQEGNSGTAAESVSETGGAGEGGPSAGSKMGAWQTRIKKQQDDHPPQAQAQTLAQQGSTSGSSAPPPPASAPPSHPAHPPLAPNMARA